jgi:hypothetical protein
VRVTDDISVSRKHAFIQRSPSGDYYLVDNKSKFGTLIQIQYPVFLSMHLLHHTPLVLQSGKTCMTINVKAQAARNQTTSCWGALCRLCCTKKEPPKHSTNLLTLDGISYFPREFVDFKQFNSTKAHAIEESDEEEEVKFD